MGKESAQPWERVIVCGPGDIEALKKAGEEARDLTPIIPDDVTVIVDGDKKDIDKTKPQQT